MQKEGNAYPKGDWQHHGGTPGICRGALMGGEVYQTGPVLATVSDALPETSASGSEGPQPCSPSPHPCSSPTEKEKTQLLEDLLDRGLCCLPARPQQPLHQEGAARESVLRVPTSVLLHFSKCLLLLRQPHCHGVTWLSRWESCRSPACQVILAIFLALSGP